MFGIKGSSMVFGIIGIMLLAGAMLGKIGWGWGVLGAIFLYGSATRFWTKYKAASNAILARHTFDLLSETDRKKVLAEVSAIMSNAKYPSQDPEQKLKSMAPEQRYGFLALGMARIGIAPKIEDGWYDVRNPYAEILGAHREIAWVKHQIRLKYGVDVNLNDVVVTSTEQHALERLKNKRVESNKREMERIENECAASGFEPVVEKTVAVKEIVVKKATAAKMPKVPAPSAPAPVHPATSWPFLTPEIDKPKTKPKTKPKNTP